MSGNGIHIIFYLNLFVLCGVALRHFFKRLASYVPYTVLLMLIGVLLGVAALAAPQGDKGSSANVSGSGSGTGDGSGSSSATSSGSGGRRLAGGAEPDTEFLSVMSVLAGLDPHTMLYIFLPALLFESAQVCEAAPRPRALALARRTSCASSIRVTRPAAARSGTCVGATLHVSPTRVFVGRHPCAAVLTCGQAIDFHVFRKVTAKTLTLAFPGMALGSLLMGCLVKVRMRPPREAPRRPHPGCAQKVCLGASPPRTQCSFDAERGRWVAAQRVVARGTLS